MPVDMSKYPDDWNEIRNKILLRAGGDADDPKIGAVCEWCGVQNYAVGYRDQWLAADYVKPDPAPFGSLLVPMGVPTRAQMDLLHGLGSVLKR